MLTAVNIVIFSCFRVSIVAKKFEGQANTKEEWYGTEYKLEKIPQEKLQVKQNLKLGIIRATSSS